MFTEVRRGGSWTLLGVSVVVGAALIYGYSTGRFEGASSPIDLALAGVNPMASPWADAHHDNPYATSPLESALTLEALLGPTSAPPVLAFADELARDMGFWLLRHTGTSSIEEAEVALWATGPPDAFAMELARRLRKREVYLRRNKRLGVDGVDGLPVYMHPDELVWVAAHVAWRLDLKTTLVHSPTHQYLRWDKPDGDLARTLEITCFRRIDALGKTVPSDEFSVGRRLTGPADHYPSGAGGIHASLGTDYHDIDDGMLLTEQTRRMLLWRDHTTAETVLELLGARPESEVASLWFSIHMTEGLAAWEAGDAKALKTAAKETRRLRDTWPDTLPAAPDEAVLAVAAKLDEASLRPVFATYEPSGPVERPVNSVHAAAMWLDLSGRSSRLEDFNGRVVPLMNVTTDPHKVQQLCGYGRRALVDATENVEQLLPPCAKPWSPQTPSND